MPTVGLGLFFLGVGGVDVTQLRARGFGILVPEHVEEGCKVLESLGKKDHVEAVIFLLQEVATINAVQLIADGEGGATGEFVRLFVVRVPLYVQEPTQHGPVAVDYPVKVPLLKAGHATLSVAVLTVDGEVGVLGEVVPIRVEEEHRAGPDLLLFNQIVEEQTVRDLLLKINRVTISAAPKTANGESGTILESVRPHVGQDFNF